MLNMIIPKTNAAIIKATSVGGKKHKALLYQEHANQAFGSHHI